MTTRANPFIHTRQRHFEETAEDYTELIADLIAEHGEARTCEIAKHLGVSHVTVVRTLKRLQSEGYLTTAPHKPVVLTEKGASLAQSCKKRHSVVVDFLLSLGISESVAEMDAEGMEHHISDETLEAFRKHLNLLTVSHG